MDVFLAPPPAPFTCSLPIYLDLNLSLSLSLSLALARAFLLCPGRRLRDRVRNSFRATLFGNEQTSLRSRLPPKCCRLGFPVPRCGARAVCRRISEAFSRLSSAEGNASPGTFNGMADDASVAQEFVVRFSARSASLGSLAFVVLRRHE